MLAAVAATAEPDDVGRQLLVAPGVAASAVDIDAPAAAADGDSSLVPSRLPSRHVCLLLGPNSSSSNTKTPAWCCSSTRHHDHCQQRTAPFVVVLVAVVLCAVLVHCCVVLRGV